MCPSLTELYRVYLACSRQTGEKKERAPRRMSRLWSRRGIGVQKGKRTRVSPLTQRPKTKKERARHFPAHVLLIVGRKGGKRVEWFSGGGETGIRADFLRRPLLSRVVERKRGKKWARPPRFVYSSWARRGGKKPVFKGKKAAAIITLIIVGKGKREERALRKLLDLAPALERRRPTGRKEGASRHIFPGRWGGRK